MSNFAMNSSVSTWSSIFVPRIDYRITKTRLRTIFEQKYQAGQLTRIDFVDVAPDKGSGRMAFLHFDKWTNSDFSIYMRNQIETNGFMDIQEQIDNDVVIIHMLINKRPVPKSTLNVDQLTDMFSRLNDDFSDMRDKMQCKIVEQDEEIAYLKIKIQMLENKDSNGSYAIEINDE